MNERAGTCRKCGSTYKVPESFAATTAVCKKCGGTVVIKARPAPSSPSASSSAPAPTPPGIRRSGRLAAAKDRSPATRPGRALLIGVGAVVILGAAGVFWAMNDAEKESSNVAASSTTEGPERASPIATTQPNPAALAKDAGESKPASQTHADEKPSATEILPSPADPGANLDPSAIIPPSEQAPAEEGGSPANEEGTPQSSEPLKTTITFPLFPKTPDTSDEEWSQIQALMEELAQGGKARSRALTKLLPFGIKAIPALINALDGTDFTQASSWVDAFETCKFIRDDLTKTVVKIGFHGDVTQSEDDIRFNVAAIKDLVRYWKERVDNPTLYQATADKIAKELGK